MRNLASFFFLLIWLSFGAWFYVCQIKNIAKQPWFYQEPSPISETPKTPKKKEIIKPEKLKKAYQSIFTAEQDFFFYKSNWKIKFSEKFDNSLDEIADFLNNHKETKLTITGYYSPLESNDTEFDNIGYARVNQIKQQLQQKGVDSKQLVLYTDLKLDLFDEDEKADGNKSIDFKFSENYEELNETDVKTAYRTLFELQNNISFKKNEQEIKITKEVQKGIEKLLQYLNRNKDQGIGFEVKYEEEETNPFKSNNIGFLRAYNLKQELTQFIEKDRVEIDSDVQYKVFDENNVSLPDAILFNFIFPDKSDESKLAEMKLERELEKMLSKQTNVLSESNKLNYTDNLTASTSNSVSPKNEGSSEHDLFFAFGSDQVVVDKNFADYVARLKSFLKKHSGKKVHITGHTCNIGDASFNNYLGLKRANAARAALEKYGIGTFKLITHSKGESKPTYSNDSELGRSKNRRVEIDIK